MKTEIQWWPGGEKTHSKVGTHVGDILLIAVSSTNEQGDVWWSFEIVEITEDRMLIAPTGERSEFDWSDVAWYADTRKIALPCGANAAPRVPDASK